MRRSSPRRDLHYLQVVDSVRDLHRDYLNRSTFGYVAIFNVLPEIVLTSSDFRRASFDIDDWDHLYKSILPLSSHSLHQFRRIDDL